VGSIKDLRLIEEHFNKFSLKSQKEADFSLFRMVIEKMRRKEHLTEDGLRKIVAIRASMN